MLDKLQLIHGEATGPGGAMRIKPVVLRQAQRETKSVPLGLRCTPSVKAKLQALAQATGMSENDLVAHLINQAELEVDNAT